MILEEKVYDYISTHAGVAAIQGARFYPVELPQDVTYPCSTYERISTVPWNDRQNSDNHRARVQVDCFAETYLAVQQLANAMWTAMLALRNTSSPRITNTQMASRRDGGKDEVGIFRVTIDFYVTFDQE